MSKIETPYAKLDNRTIFPEDAKRNPSYLCPVCTKRVVLVAGTIRKKHFRHYEESLNCKADSGETKIHLTAKSNLCSSLRKAISDPQHTVSILLPCGNCNNKHTRPFKIFGNRFNAETEHPLMTKGGYTLRADVVLICNRFDEKAQWTFVFEIYNSNNVDEDKTFEYEHSGIKWVEISAVELPLNTTTIKPIKSGNVPPLPKTDCPEYMSIKEKRKYEHERLVLNLRNLGFKDWSGTVMESNYKNGTFYYDFKKRKIWYQFKWETDDQGLKTAWLIGKIIDELKQCGIPTKIDWTKVEMTYKIHMSVMNAKRRKKRWTQKQINDTWLGSDAVI